MWITIKYIDDNGQVTGHRTPAYRLQEIMQRYGIAPEEIKHLELDGEEYPPTRENIQIIINQFEEDQA